ncbi:hypothetical protein K488DRAFT_81713 [Vararia minispora EC-137]|uniref:Uncharacterized protein n=1 Tax=Vararia minispora EC-137 TaxID=1314806 RepID=A0ACB8QY14_9AGAM|nr:hypothetical protein K488DRAFT_81713 [Vararia minispora EC-137]
MNNAGKTNSASSFASDANSLCVYIEQAPPRPATDTPDGFVWAFRLDSDLLAQLQNVGSRVRRSVSEGYQTHRFTTPAPGQRASFSRSASIPILTTDNEPIFRSANDTLHAVYSRYPSGAKTQSDRKRGRAQAAIEEEDEEDMLDGEENQSGLRTDGNTNALSDTHANRLVKALPASRAFRQTKSLPVGIFSNGGMGPPIRAAARHPRAIQEEDDWSAEAFSTPFTPAPAQASS